MASDWPWPAPIADDAVAHLRPGLPLPCIALPATTGGEIAPATLPGRLVLFIYPWTGTPGEPNPPGWDDIPGAHGSTPEAEGFRDHHAAYAQAGWQIIGLSLQMAKDQSDFSARLGLPYALVSDHARAFQQALDLPIFTTAGTAYLKRLTLLIENGRLVQTIYPVHPPDTHAQDVLSRIRQL